VERNDDWEIDSDSWQCAVFRTDGGKSSRMGKSLSDFTTYDWYPLVPIFYAILGKSGKPGSERKTWALDAGVGQ
jgi:hypothetical protein